MLPGPPGADPRPFLVSHMSSSPIGQHQQPTDSKHALDSTTYPTCTPTSDAGSVLVCRLAGKCWSAAAQSFSHSHHGTVLFERNVVHQCSHQVKSAPGSHKQPFGFGRVPDCTGIKTFSRIP